MGEKRNRNSANENRTKREKSKKVRKGKVIEIVDLQAAAWVCGNRHSLSKLLPVSRRIA